MDKPTISEDNLVWAELDNFDPNSSQPNKVIPTTSQQESGHISDEATPNNNVNYWKNLVWQYIKWLTVERNDIRFIEGTTSDDTETEFFIDGVSDQRIIIDDSSNILFEILITAIKADITQSKSWKIIGEIIRNTNLILFDLQKTLITDNNFDVSTAIYNSENFDVSSETTNPFNIFFKPDGTKMFITNGNNNIYAYDLSTAWDVSTASYNSETYDTTANETNLRGIFIKEDGTKMFIIGNANDTVYQYTLSTAWDVSTAIYDSKSKNMSTEESTTCSIWFKIDGTKCYMIGASRIVYQYDLSTAWDISTASYNSINVSLVAQVGFGSSIYFKSDGKKMYAQNGSGTDAVFAYDLSTAWDITSRVYNGETFVVVPEVGALGNGSIISNNGRKFFTTSQTNTKIFAYDLVNGWDINLEADNNNHALVFKATGQLATNINWKIRIDMLKNS